MARRKVDMRLDEELLSWADSYAVERGLSRTAVVELGLRELAASGGRAPLPAAAERSGPTVRESRDERVRRGRAVISDPSKYELPKIAKRHWAQ